MRWFYPSIKWQLFNVASPPGRRSDRENIFVIVFWEGREAESLTTGKQMVFCEACESQQFLKLLWIKLRPLCKAENYDFLRENCGLYRLILGQGLGVILSASKWSSASGVVRLVNFDIEGDVLCFTYWNLIFMLPDNQQTNEQLYDVRNHICS